MVFMAMSADATCRVHAPSAGPLVMELIPGEGCTCIVLAVSDAQMS